MNRCLALVGAMAILCGSAPVVWAQSPASATVEQTPDQRLAVELEAEVMRRVESQDWAGADELLVRLIEVELRLYGPHNGLLANSWGFRAGLADQMGDGEAGDRFRREELAIREQVGDALELERTRVRMGQSLLARGRTDEAEAALAQAMDTGTLPAAEQVVVAEALIEIRRGAGRTTQNEAALRARMVAYEAQALADRTVLARARHDMAIWLRNAGRAAEAEPLARDAWRTYAEVEGAEAPSTAIIAENLGLVLAAMGRRDEAEDILRASASVPGATLQAKAARLRALGGLMGADRAAEAAILYRQVLDLDVEAAPGTRALDWARLAGVLGRAGDRTGAVEARREAVAIRRLGADQAALFRELALMSEGLNRLGLSAEAYEVIEEAWPMRQASGLIEAEQMYALWQRSTAQLAVGRAAEAEISAVEVVALRRQTPVDAGWLSLALQAQAAAQVELGKFADADAALTEARALAASQPGNLSVPLIDNARANLLNVQGRFDEAQALYHSAIQELERQGPSERGNLALVMGNLAGSLKAGGRFERAVDLYLEAVAAARQEAGGRDTARLLALELSLGAAYSAAGRLDEATDVLTSVAGRAEALLGQTHPTTLGALREGALVLMGSGQPEMAEPVFLHLVEATAERYGAGSYQMIEVLQLQAYAAYVLHKTGEAVEMMRRAEAVADLHPTRWPRLQIDVRANLGQALMHDDRLDEALPVLREAMALAIRRRRDGLEVAGPGLVLNRPFQWTVRAAWEAAH